jgi:hypothetical protein
MRCRSHSARPIRSRLRLEQAAIARWQHGETRHWDVAQPTTDHGVIERSNAQQQALTQCPDVHDKRCAATNGDGACQRLVLKLEQVRVRSRSAGRPRWRPCRRSNASVLSHRRKAAKRSYRSTPTIGAFQTRRLLGLLVEPQAKVIYCKAATLSCLSRLRCLPIARNGLKYAHAVAFGIKK